MTLVPRYWVRPGLDPLMPEESRLFQVTREARILGHCHWQEEPRRHTTLILVHGLEGCSASHYMRVLTAKAWTAGWNIVRLNQRNCGGTEHLTPTLYNTGLSGDYATVVRELSTRDGLSTIWLVGYSMGGNLVLKCAGESNGSLGSLKGVAAVSPSIDAALCVTAIERRENWIYHRYFLTSIRKRLRRKAKSFPARFDLTRLSRIRTLREFDEMYTAPDGNYANASEYYEKSSAMHQLPNIQVPTIIITAQDDPVVPFAQFENPALRNNPAIRLVAPKHGGHCGFIQSSRTREDQRWAENRILDFVRASG